MAIMFFKDAGGVNTPHDGSMVANALLQLQTSRGLRAVLFIVGFLLVVYGECVSRGCLLLSQTGCTTHFCSHLLLQCQHS